MRPIPHDPACFANHMGLWLMEPAWLREALAHIQSGTWLAMSEDDAGDPHPIMAGDGVAVIQIAGPMMKGRSKFGGTSTVAVRRQLREMANDKAVESILLHVDSPGGHVAGTADLADDIAAVNRIKPVHAHIDDTGASAALWAVSQARRITANRSAEVGSMGVIGMLVDQSKKLEAEGVKVHVISTGSQKRIGFDPEVTDADLAVAQARANEVFGHFKSDVRRGRGDRLPASSMATLSDGRVVGAREAVALGLIDGIGTIDAALSGMPSRRRRSRAAAAGLALARMRASLPRKTNP